MQTDITNSNLDYNKLTSQSKVGLNHSKTQKTLKFRFSETNLISERLKHNSDLQGRENSEKGSLRSDNHAIWSSSKKRVGTITNVVFQENNFMFNGDSSTTSVLPKLKNSISRNNTAQNEMYKTHQTSIGTGAGEKLLSPKSKFSESQLEKQAKLQSIYSENKKLGLIKKVQKDTVMVDKISRNKANIKELIKNATARS